MWRAINLLVLKQNISRSVCMQISYEFNDFKRRRLHSGYIKKKGAQFDMKETCDILLYPSKAIKIIGFS